MCLPLRSCFAWLFKRGNGSERSNKRRGKLIPLLHQQQVQHEQHEPGKHGGALAPVDHAHAQQAADVPENNGWDLPPSLDGLSIQFSGHEYPQTDHLKSFYAAPYIPSDPDFDDEPINPHNKISSAKQRFHAEASKPRSLRSLSKKL